MTSIPALRKSVLTAELPTLQSSGSRYLSARPEFNTPLEKRYVKTIRKNVLDRGNEKTVLTGAPENKRKEIMRMMEETVLLTMPVHHQIITSMRIEVTAHC